MKSRRFAQSWCHRRGRESSTTKLGLRSRRHVSPEECIANEIPLYLWIKPIRIGDSFENMQWENFTAPEGWESFKGQYPGGIDVLVLPNGKVIAARGKPFQNNNGTTYAVMSPLDFWTPGSGLLAAGIRGLTSRITAAAVRGLDAIVAATSKELALFSARELTLGSVSRTLSGVAVSTRGLLSMEHLAGRTIIAGEDLAKIRAVMPLSQTQAGFYDVFIHGDSTSFKYLVKTVGGKKIWRDVSIREIADAIRPRLLPGDKIRLLACDVGNTGGPAQELADELNRTVWASNTVVDAVPQGVGVEKAFVPRDGGTFSEFVPSRGAAKLPGTGGKVTGNEVSGEINRIHPRPPR